MMIGTSVTANNGLDGQPQTSIGAQAPLQLGAIKKIPISLCAVTVRGRVAGPYLHKKPGAFWLRVLNS